MLLPYNTYNYPSTKRGISVGIPVAVNSSTLYISDFLTLHLSELYGYITALTNFLVKKEFLVHRPILIFQPTVNSRTSDNRTKQCQNRISQLGKMGNY